MPVWFAKNVIWQERFYFKSRKLNRSVLARCLIFAPLGGIHLLSVARYVLLVVDQSVYCFCAWAFSRCVCFLTYRSYNHLSWMESIQYGLISRKKLLNSIKFPIVIASIPFLERKVLTERTSELGSTVGNERVEWKFVWMLDIRFV